MLNKIITTLILIITLVIMFNVVLPTPVAVENVKKAQAQVSATSTSATSTPETPVKADEPQASDDDEDIPIPLPSDELAASIVVVLAYYESGGDGDCSKPGASGEMGCFQYLWDTWITYSNDVLGYVPEKTKEMEMYVTYAKVLGWLDQGLTPRQIFLMWNQGHPGQCIRGVNDQGVPYDSCFYADRGVNKLIEITTTYGTK